MAGLFTEASGSLSPEQITKIAKRGGVLNPDEKSPEEKVYLVVFKSLYDLNSSIIGETEDGTELPIDGECIVVHGRHRTFDRIRKFISLDTDDWLDVRKSFVCVEGVDPSNAVSLYRFIELCNSSYPNEAVDLSELIYEDSEISSDNNEVIATAQATGMANFGGTLLRED